MNNLALLFIISSLYSIINYNRLSLSVLNRVYKNKIQVYSDIIFYAVELFYFIWIILNIIFNLEITWPLLLFMIVSWIFLRKKNSKNNLIYQILKIGGLILIYLQIKTF
jgi:hypothetical protein